MNAVCANASRLYKYLVPSYFEQFRQSVYDWATRVWKEEPHDEMAAATQRLKVEGLQQLFGKDVLPDVLMAFYPLHMEYPHVVEGQVGAGGGELGGQLHVSTIPCCCWCCVSKTQFYLTASLRVSLFGE